MDFAAEPVLDAFTPPPTRAARPTVQANDTGQTFEEHLDAANETASETGPTPRTEPTPDALNAEATGEQPAVNTQDAIDPNVALLGGPIVAPPAIAAPVMVQIAMAQPAQPPTQPGAANTDEAAPVAAPQTPTANAPLMDTPAARPVAAAPTEPATKKDAGAEAKAPANAAKAEAPPQTTNAPAQTAQAPIVTPQTSSAATQASQVAPITIGQLPTAVQQAIAATIAPVQQAAVPVGQRVAKPTADTGDAKQTPEANAAKTVVPPTPNANPKAQIAKTNVITAMANEPAAASAPQTGATDTQQIAQTPTITTTASQASTHAQHIAADASAQRAGSAATQVGREIIRRFDGGNASFEIRLDPAELGRVEVRMEVSRDHRVTAVITADSPQALTELARHARELESQLQSAGLQLSDSGLSFDLRQQTNGREAQDANASQSANGADQAAPEQQVAQTARPIGFERWRGVRVDMMV